MACLVRPSVTRFKIQCPKRHQHSTLTPTACTCTSVRVASLGRVARTVLTAIRRCRFAASSCLSPAATSYRAPTKTAPSTVESTVPCNAGCNATHQIGEQRQSCVLSKVTRRVDIVCTPCSRIPLYHCMCPLYICNKLVTPSQACVLHNAHAAPTQSLPPLAGSGLLQVLL